MPSQFLNLRFCVKVGGYNQTPTAYPRQKRALYLSDCHNTSGGEGEEKHVHIFFDVLLTVQLSIFISVINQLGAQHFKFTISLFHACRCFEHMCSKHVQA